jgi:beta-lactamase class A
MTAILWRATSFLVVLAVMAGFVLPASHIQPAHASVLCPPDNLTPETTAQPQTVSTYAYRLVVPGLAVADASPPPPPPPVSPELLALRDRLAALVDGSGIPGQFAVAVTDLESGQTVGVGLDRPQAAGCIMNLFAIVAVLQDVDAGRYPLESVDATIRQTIWASDATAARELYRAAGGGDVVEGVRVVARLLQQLGMTSSVIDHPPAFPDESIGVQPDNIVTARDVNTALAHLYRGDVLSPSLTEYLIEAMTHVKPGLNYLTAIVPPPAVVSHKNGFFWQPDGFVDNDASIVRFGPSLEYGYALTFLSQGVQPMYADIPLGQQLVLEAWDYFASAY